MLGTSVWACTAQCRFSVFSLLRGPNIKHRTVAVDVGYDVQVLWPEFEDAIPVFTAGLM